MKSCEECGKQFKQAVFWQKYCSEPCKWIAYGKKKKAEALKEANKVMKK